jgi:signal transduction histidine kinase
VVKKLAMSLGADVVGIADYHPAAIARTFEEDAKYYVEFRVVWQDGSINWLNSRAKVERDHNGQDVRMSGGAIDVTRHKLEETLKNEFISNVSHELPTPLTSIYGSLGLLLGDVYGKLPDDVKSLINVAIATVIAWSA